MQDDGPRSQRHPGERFATDAGFARARSEVVKRRLSIDDEQEDIVDHAVLRPDQRERAADWLAGVETR